MPIYMYLPLHLLTFPTHLFFFNFNLLTVIVFVFESTKHATILSSQRILFIYLFYTIGLSHFVQTQRAQVFEGVVVQGKLASESPTLFETHHLKKSHSPFQNR